MDNSALRKYWDSVAGKKSFTLNLYPDILFKYLNPADKILDYGCGYGRIFSELEASGFHHLCGCDISPKMIELAKKDFPDIELRVNQGAEIPFEPDSFDAIIVLAVLTSIITDSEQQLLIQEIKRTLKPGGIVYIGDFLINNDDRNLERYNRSREKYGYHGIFELPEGATLRHHDKSYIAELFSPFEQLEMTEVTHTTMNGNKSKGFYYVGRAKQAYP